MATESLLENIIDETERRTCFLYKYLRDTDRFDWGADGNRKGPSRSEV